jgi:hypothetical protein
MKTDFQPCQEPNDVGEECGCFRSNSTMHSGEDGVRPNADMGMVCAFLCKYGQGRVQLPSGVTWAELQAMAMRSLVFAYSTHKANRLKKCSDGRYWGSVSQRDHAWESSLWAMSVAYCAHFLWDVLSPRQREYVYRLLKAECDYELQRAIPTGHRGDTKAEENGWEACVLAATLGLFPDDEQAPLWFERMRQFAVNSYSHPRDASDTRVIDPGYDYRRVCDLYQGPNLYADYTLQNHNYFHTSYQNVVIQELGEAALALRLFQGKEQRWQTEALLHNCREVCDSVLYWLALSDGELAMPNGNDWSLFLYDQITSYTTMACLTRDADALMLEQKACAMIAHRQGTTPDGSWLLRSDIGARRMGVQAHRVMMSWLMHHVWPTADMQPSTWHDFASRYSGARMLKCQNIVRASSRHRFTCFSWSDGLKSYTGYIAPHQESALHPAHTNLIVPFKANNTGNLLGWYEVEGRRTNAVPAPDCQPRCDIVDDGQAWTWTAALLCNDSVLDHRFAIYSTPGNAVIYIDNVRARENLTVKCEKGGLTAISMDESTARTRNVKEGRGYVSVDETFGIVMPRGKRAKLDEPRNNNSVMTALLYASYDDKVRRYKKGQQVDCRPVVYYSNVPSSVTEEMARGVSVMKLPEGWAGVLAPDTDGSRYMLVAHFHGEQHTVLTPYGHVTLMAGQSLGCRVE